METKIIKVKNSTPPKELGKSIFVLLKQGEEIEIRTIGAGAISQAIKGIIIATEFCSPVGIEFYNKPLFFDGEVEIVNDGNVSLEKRTGIKFLIKRI